MTTIRYNSSLRSRPVEETLRHARAMAREYGVIRVTDTTRLDRLGVPVFAGIRPGAVPRSLCVSAGKGLVPEEAEVGAYMEAIELACAEPATAALPIVRITGHALRASGYPLIDYCPRSDIDLDEDVEIDCVVATELDTGRAVHVPASRVLFPYVTQYFGSDTNGLASGNTRLEATAHGLAEAFERDIATMQGVADRSQRIANTTLPAHLAELVARTEAHGLVLAVRTAFNEFGLPFFTATLREPGVRDAVHGGMGCHPWATIAVTRAVCEAFQSRLTYIHGGRDDLQGPLNKFMAMSETARIEEFHARANARESDPTIAYAEVPDLQAATPTIEDVYAVLREAGERGGLGKVLRVALTAEDRPLQVVKVIVPRMEFFTGEADARMGPRLRALTGDRRPRPVF
jgi:ribosomal protein S12 methylthiotransferase accessory factor